MKINIEPPVHPGEYLRDELLKPLGITPYGLARHLKVPRTRIERLVREETSISPDTALRLSRYFDISPAFWLNMQMDYDLAKAEKASAAALAQIEPLRRVAA